MTRALALVLGLMALLVAAPLLAQDVGQMDADEQRDWLVQLVEGQLSTPERQIRLSNIEGLLSERSSIREITIADQEGVWLRIENAALDWNQGALFGGRLEIRSLSAERIDVIRNPVPSDTIDLPAPEAGGGLAVPELPVAVILEELSVPLVTFGESVFGLGSEISVAGGLRLEGGDLDANLDVTRLDGPGGSLDLDVTYRREGQVIDIDVSLTEPENGIIANLLSIDGRPPITLAISGSGPVAELRTELTLDAGGQRVLGGAATITQAPEGFRLAADLRGPIGTLVAERFRPFFGAETALTATALVRQEGGISLSDLRLSGGQMTLAGRAETAEDGFPTLLDLTAVIADPTGARVRLPLPGEPTELQRAELVITYGEGHAWTGTLNVGDITAPGLAARTLALSVGGVAANLADPANRRVTFNGDGVIGGISAASPEVQAALGDSVGLGLAGLWHAGEPVQLPELRIAGEALSLVLAGTLDDFVFDGKVAIDAASIAPFSGIAGRDLGGSLDLDATGTMSPLIGGFDLRLDGTARNLRLGEDALDAVLRGDAQLSGRLARTEAGIAAEDFRLANGQLTLTADGRIASTAADFTFRAELADLALLSPEASGALTVTGRAAGADGPIAVDLVASVPTGRLAGKPLREAVLRLDARLEGSATNGEVAGTAILDGQRVSLTAGLTAADGTWRLGDMLLDAAGTRISGELAQQADGALSGAVAIDAPDISTAAALVLLDATGSIDGTATIGGTIAAPQASFRLQGSGIDAAQIRPYGIAPLRFDAAGSLAGNAIRFDSVSATGAGGLSLTARGSLPLSGGGGDLAVTGSAPLALGNRFLADRGGQLSGTVRLDARVTGSLASPSFAGTVSTSDAGYVDPELGLRLIGISGSARLDGNRLVIDALNGSLATGGTLSVAGSVGLDEGNPAELRLRLNSARYANGDFLVATLSGELALSGRLAAGPRLSGSVLVEEANIIVPETFGGAGGLIDVRHVRPAPAVQATLARARQQQTGRPAPRSADLVLDVTVRAPNRVFIRGRGLDAEMGGEVHLSGPVSDIVAVGGFALERGRLSILGQRITFESGSVTLTGDLDPYIDLVARTEGDGITVFVTVSGRASEPDISFSSNPPLPQDEVLSRLIFNRSMGELSPLQLARLAGAAAELAGGGTSLTESLRGAAGLADLDIVTDESGNVAVQAGQYIQENIYLGVQAGADGQSRVTVNLDITDDLRARASAGADGNSSIGIFYETDY